MAYFNTNFSYHRQKCFKSLKWPIYTPRWRQGFSACFCSFCCVGYAVVWPSSAHLLSSGAPSSERLLDYNRMVSLVCHIYVFIFDFRCNDSSTSCTTFTRYRTCTSSKKLQVLFKDKQSGHSRKIVTLCNFQFMATGIRDFSHTYLLLEFWKTTAMLF